MENDNTTHVSWPFHGRAPKMTTLIISRSNLQQQTTAIDKMVLWYVCLFIEYTNKPTIKANKSDTVKSLHRDSVFFILRLNGFISFINYKLCPISQSWVTKTCHYKVRNTSQTISTPNNIPKLGPSHQTNAAFNQEMSVHLKDFTKSYSIFLSKLGADYQCLMKSIMLQLYYNFYSH